MNLNYFDTKIRSFTDNSLHKAVVTWQFKFTIIQIPTIQILMRFSRCHISEYILKLKKVKMCHPEEINKDYDWKKKVERKELLKKIMHNNSEFELSEIWIFVHPISVEGPS